MATVINLLPKGALKQGQRFASLDFASGGIWDLALVKIGTSIVLFGKHSTQSVYSPLAKEGVMSWALSDVGLLKDVTYKYALPSIQTTGMAYVQADTEIGVYTDGAGAFSETPYTTKTTEQTIKDILGGSDASTSTPATDDKKWYQKWQTYVAAVVILGLGYLGYKHMK